MAQNANGVDSTSKSFEELQDFYRKNHRAVEMFDSKQLPKTLRDVSRSANKTVSTFDKATLRNYFANLGGSEVNLRNVSRYLYYRSNIYYRLVEFYADMWDLRCRKVIPKYEITKDNNPDKFMKSFSDTLKVLETVDEQGSYKEVLTRCYVEDVSYNIAFYEEDVGFFFYMLDADICKIDGRYFTKDFSFSVDMSKYNNQQGRQLIEFLGEPLKSMYAEYERTGEKWIHMPDEYAACFKFRTDQWDLILPPFLPLFNEYINNVDCKDNQAVADALSIFKLIYMPIKTLSGSKEPNDFAVSPDFAKIYYDQLDDALPDYISSAIVPVEELKTIDFDDSVSSDIDRVENSTKNILSTSGGGAILNSNNITSTAAFNAWLKSETEFAISTLLPQIDGFINRFLENHLSNPAKVKHFEISIYTKEEFRQSLLESNQYGFANRIAYNTLLGISEQETLSELYLETEVLKLQDKMVYPLSSSFTTSGNPNEVGRPMVDDDELSDSGERTRNE